jgi:hypothetical protein
VVKLAGIPHEKVVFINGNSKSKAELRAAVEAQVTVWYPWTLFKYLNAKKKYLR